MDANEQAQRILNGLTPGEWLVAAGAAWILVVDYLIGVTITEDYWSGILLIAAPLSLALLAAVLVKHSGNESAWNHLYPATVNAAGVGIVVFVVLDLLNGIANDFSSSGEFYEITLYIAAAVILGGMIQMRQQSSAE